MSFPLPEGASSASFPSVEYASSAEAMEDDINRKRQRLEDVEAAKPKAKPKPEQHLSSLQAAAAAGSSSSEHAQAADGVLMEGNLDVWKNEEGEVDFDTGNEDCEL